MAFLCGYVQVCITALFFRRACLGERRGLSLIGHNIRQFESFALS